MQTTRRAFLFFTLALGLGATQSPKAMGSAGASQFWEAVNIFAEYCMAETPTPETMAYTASRSGWLQLSADATKNLTPPLGVIPGVHLAWRIGEPPNDVVVEVGGTGAWSFAAQDAARARGERLQGPLPGIAEPGADDRFGFSNHWACIVHFRSGDADAIVEHLLRQSVRETELGAPFIKFDDLSHRPGWASVDWHLAAERSHVSFTYQREPADGPAFTRELHLGRFTKFEAPPH